MAYYKEEFGNYTSILDQTKTNQRLYFKDQIFFKSMSHQQLQIAPGVYITDFRKDGTLVGITQPKKQLTNDVGLLLDDCSTIESKCKMLEYSIEQIEKQQNWESDRDFVEAIEDNWKVIIRLTAEMKQKVLRLFELKYHPSNSKVEELLNIDRIDIRQTRAWLALQKLKGEETPENEMEQQDNGVYL